MVKHEALAVRADRERILAGPAAAAPEPGREDWVAMLPADADGPARAGRAPRSGRPQPRGAADSEAAGAARAHPARRGLLLARDRRDHRATSRTKVNRCLAEGRERFRPLPRRAARTASRCTELGPLLSAFGDGEAGAADAATLREHLRACAHCRATLRAYRAAPRAAAALAPTLPGARSLVDRAHEAFAGLASRLNGGVGATDSALSQAAATGGTRGAGMAALAKVVAICVGTVGGAAACVATGVVPAPLEIGHSPAKAVTVERRIDPVVEAEWSGESGVDYETAPEPAPAEPAPQPVHHSPAPTPQPVADPAPAASGGAVEYTPEPAPAPAPEPSSASSSAAASSGSAAGEFGP